MLKKISLVMTAVILFTACMPYISSSTHKTTIKSSLDEGFPEYFNWHDMDGVDWTTPAKDQGRYGACGLFGSVGALESVIKIREQCPDFNPDLSEQFLISCMPYVNSGSSIYNVFHAINETGIPLESCLPYQASDEVPCSSNECGLEKNVPIKEFNCYHPSYANDPPTKDEIRVDIKEKLMEKGPITFEIFNTMYIKPLSRWGLTHHSPDDYYSGDVSLDDYLVNHGVTVVGWKDIPDKIESGGYWIIKNSWGDKWGYDGFFNLEYGSLNCDMGRIGWVDYNPDDYNWAPIGKPQLSEPEETENGIKYTFSSIDPEGDQVYYKFSWGDNTESEWVGPYESGGECTASHKYQDNKKYAVKVKAKDVYDSESEWMPEETKKSFPIFSGSFNDRIIFKIKQIFPRLYILFEGVMPIKTCGCE